VLNAAEQEDSITRELALTALPTVLNASMTKNVLSAIKDTSYNKDNVSSDAQQDGFKET
jgi:hypothetical protein